MPNDYLPLCSTSPPLVTIITVVFNGEEYLAETIESVASQTYRHIEYIIIDGGSTDSTLNIISAYKDVIDHWISEKDSGIYDAMNKGVQLASGDWICFMNCGDTFSSIATLSEVFASNHYTGIDIIYGGHNIVYSDKSVYPGVVGDHTMLKYGSQFSHQSAFISIRHHMKLLYNSELKLVADFDFFYHSFMASANFIRLNTVISNCQTGGVSDKHRFATIIGWWCIVDKTATVNLYYLNTLTKEAIKSLIKYVFPKLSELFRNYHSKLKL